MDIKQIQIDFLTKFYELTSLQCIKSSDLEKIDPSQLNKNRIVSRVLNSEIGINKYESHTDDENYRYFKQTNVNRLSLTFNMITDYDNVLKCHNFFNHLVGSRWWSDRILITDIVLLSVLEATGLTVEQFSEYLVYEPAKFGRDYVIEEVTSIIDLSDIIDADYRTKYSFDIVLRVSDEVTQAIELVKVVDFEIIVKNN